MKTAYSNKLLDILREIRPGNDFAKSQDFVSDGLLDSFDIITLVAKLESCFGISIDGKDVRAENFKNLKTLKKFVLYYVPLHKG